jgi:hypothetical protein
MVKAAESGADATRGDEAVRSPVSPAGRAEGVVAADRNLERCWAAGTMKLRAKASPVRRIKWFSMEI